MSSPQLLLDENLSERLLPLLMERFPSSTHGRLIGLGGAIDTAIWEWASQQNLVLVTKDEDFLDLSVTQGCPPKVVCLAIGNASNAATAILLLQHCSTRRRSSGSAATRRPDSCCCDPQPESPAHRNEAEPELDRGGLIGLRPLERGPHLPHPGVAAGPAWGRPCRLMQFLHSGRAGLKSVAAVLAKGAVPWLSVENTRPEPRCSLDC